MIAAPPLAGRRSELRAIVAAVTPPSPGPIVVTGEAGIGKTRLVTEAAAQAEVPFLTGWCQRHSSDLPFLPFLDLLRGIRELDGGRVVDSALRRCPGFVRVELAVLVPELGAGVDDPDLIATGWRRQRLFDSVRRLLDEVHHATHAVAVVEDLHWADASSIELCDYLLAPGRCSMPLVLTCRADEAALDTLETIMNRAGASTVDLGPLTAAQTKKLLGTVLGHAVPDTTAQEVRRRTGGNAFFTEQLAAAAGDAPGAELPAGLRELLLRRVADTDADQQRLIAALALYGRPVQEAAVAQISGWTADRIADTMRGLVRRRLVRSLPDGYVLRHALLGEAVAEELLGSERVALHRAIGDFLSDRAGPTLAGEVADHFEAAHDPAQELPWRVRAAQHAEAVLAPGEAVAHWRRVIALWDQAQDQPAVGTTLPDAYYRACQASQLAGRGHEGRELAEAALDRCEASATMSQRARLYFALGHTQSGGAPDAAFAALREAVRLGDLLPPERDHAMALYHLSQDLLWHGRGHDPERDGLLHRALDVAVRCDARGVARMVRASLAAAALTAGDRPAAIKLVDEIIASDVDVNDPQSLAAAASEVVFVLSSLAQYERAAEFGRQVLAITAEQGYPNALDVVLIRGNTIVSLQELGRVGEALELSAAVPIDAGPGVANVPAMWTLTDRANLALLTGERKQALEIWQRCRAESDRFASPILARELAVLGVEILIFVDRLQDALAEGVTALETCADTTESADCGNLFSLSARAAADLAERGRSVGDEGLLTAAQAGEIRLFEVLASCREDPFAVPAVGPRRYDERNWVAEITRLNGRSDPVAWSAAAHGWEELGTPHRVAYARYRQAEAHLSTPGGRAAAAPLLREAALLAVEHVPLTRAIEQLAVHAHLTFGPAPAPPDPLAPPRLAALTERELDVLREVARGRTNAQIGATLYISPKTASVHVSNILRKLGLGSRVQAAAIAAELGLLDADGETTV